MQQVPLGGIEVGVYMHHELYAQVRSCVKFVACLWLMFWFMVCCEAVDDILRFAAGGRRVHTPHRMPTYSTIERPTSTAIGRGVACMIPARELAATIAHNR